MSSSTILPSYFSTKVLLKGSLLSSLLLLSIGPAFAVTVPLAVKAQSGVHPKFAMSRNA